MPQPNTNRTKLPFPTTWNLKLLYQSATDPQIELDLKSYEEKRASFAKKYVDRTDYLTEENALLEALTEYEQLLNELNGARPLIYFHYLTAIQAGNTQAQAQLNKITTQLTKAYNELTFFPIKLGKIDPAWQTKFLASPKLARYQRYLSRRFALAQYDLEEAQEKILNLTQQTGYSMWVNGVEKTLNQATINWQGKKIPVSEAVFKISDLPTKPRRQLHQKVLNRVVKLKEFAECEINAVITHKSIEDDLRGIKKPYLSSLLEADNQEEVVLKLVETVTQNFDLAHRFYQLKAKLLKEKQLTYADRSAKISEVSHQYSHQEAHKIVMQTLDSLDGEFGMIFQNMQQTGQLDVFPRKNKVGGAFCSSSTNNPTYVLLNHVGSFDCVTTLAHEIGHAIHSELSKSQPVLYQSYSTSLAETASTFFEQLVFEKMVERFSKKEKIAALHNRLQDDINTIFRQVALFNFELELHQKVREVGYLDYRQLGKLLNKHTQAYLGPVFKLTGQDGYFFILWSHIRRFFYTYTYAFGHLVSKELANMVKSNPNDIDKVKQILQAGSSDQPHKILQEAGINILDTNFFANGLKSVQKDLEKLEQLTL